MTIFKIEVELTSEEIDSVLRAQTILEHHNSNRELQDLLESLWRKLAKVALQTIKT